MTIESTKSSSKKSSEKPSKAKLTDERFLNIYELCAKLVFGELVKRPRYLRKTTLRRTRSTKFKLQKGRAASVICYNPDWLDEQFDKQGIFNPCNIIDYVLTYMNKLKQGK